MPTPTASKGTPSTPKAPKGITKEKVRRRHEQGDSPREISLLLGISTQAVYQHLREIEAEQAEAS